MRSIITSYLIQTGECSLTHIGTIIISSRPAGLDIVHKQLFPPVGEISFTEDGSENSPGLVKYIAHRKNFSIGLAENMLNDFCSEWKERIDTGESLLLDTLGSLQKNSAGNIFFKRQKMFEFLRPVAAERVLHKDAELTLLVGDEEVSSAAVTEYPIDEPVAKKNKWGVWALALAAIGLATAMYHFSSHSYNSPVTGNQTHFGIDSPLTNHHDIPGN